MRISPVAAAASTTTTAAARVLAETEAATAKIRAHALKSCKAHHGSRPRQH